MNRISDVIGSPQNDTEELLSNCVIHAAINVAFLALTTLVLWPLGRVTFAFQLAKGYVLFWIVMIVVALVLNNIQSFFRLNIYDHFDAFIISNLLPSGFLVAGWSAFAVLAVQSVAATMSGWVVGVLYFFGFLSSYVAFLVISSFYTGQIYKTVNAVLALLSFVVFALWPASGRALYGWFFALF